MSEHINNGGHSQQVARVDGDVRVLLQEARDQIHSLAGGFVRADQLIARIDAALSAQPAERQGEAKPVAWRYRLASGEWRYATASEEISIPSPIVEAQPLYTHPAAPVGVPDGAIEAAAIECARRAYGYWKGDGTGGQSAIDYFDKGLPARQWHIDFYAEILRKHLIAAAPSAREVQA